ncbi:MAG: hypothetical protein JNL57_12505 [Bacteroidetes bacterium]|nr:hypothetical protein [Bacteroidota bacterium]
MAGALLLFAAEGCKKASTVTTVDDVESLTTQAGNDMNNVPVYADDNTGNVYMENEGISADFQVEDADMDFVTGPAGGGGNDSIRAGIRQRSFVKCLSGLGLSSGQKDSVRHLLGGFMECRHTALNRARELYHQLQKHYKAKADSLMAQFRAGSITKAQLAAGMASIRVQFRTDLRAKHIAEKLDDALRNCFEKFLRQLRGVLTTNQWRAFVACHKR